MVDVHPETRRRRRRRRNDPQVNIDAKVKCLSPYHRPKLSGMTSSRGPSDLSLTLTLLNPFFASRELWLQLNFVQNKTNAASHELSSSLSRPAAYLRRQGSQTDNDLFMNEVLFVFICPNEEIRQILPQWLPNRSCRPFPSPGGGNLSMKLRGSS